MVLEAVEGEVSTVFSGTGRTTEPVAEPLSQIIATLNERFGKQFDPKDRVFLDTVAAKLIDRPDIQAAAAVNSPENFELVLEKEFLSGVVAQLEASEELAVSYLDDPAFQAQVLAAYVPFVQGKAKVAWQEH